MSHDPMGNVRCEGTGYLHDAVGRVLDAIAGRKSCGGAKTVYPWRDALLVLGETLRWVSWTTGFPGEALCLGLNRAQPDGPALLA